MDTFHYNSVEDLFTVKQWLDFSEYERSNFKNSVRKLRRV